MSPSFISLFESAKNKSMLSLSSISNAYRVFNGAVDGLSGVYLDQYHQHFQLQFFSSEYLPQKKEIIHAIKQVFKPVFLVSKYRLDASGQHLEYPLMEVEIGDKEASSTIVKEGRALFVVDLLDTVNPGLFLDMRAIRLDIASRSKSKCLLNLFSYTGSFAVQARLNGAIKVVNVDISSKILEKAKENYQINHLEQLPGEFFKGNAMEYLSYAQKKSILFDGIVLDPPSFSRNKKHVFSVKKDLLNYVEICVSLLKKGGFLMVSSNYSDFSPESLAKDAVSLLNSSSETVKLEWSQSQDKDFRAVGQAKESCLSAVLLYKV